MATPDIIYNYCSIPPAGEITLDNHIYVKVAGTGIHTCTRAPLFALPMFGISISLITTESGDTAPKNMGTY